MRSFPLFSLRVAFAVSLSLSFSQSLLVVPSSFLPPSHHPWSNRNVLLSRSATRRSNPATVAADLVSLLGSEQEAARVDAEVARELRSCLRFLAPLSKNTLLLEVPDGDSFPLPRRGKVEDNEPWWWRNQHRLDEAIDELVRWPPSSVMELARLAVDSGGDPAAIQMWLDPTMHPVPNVEGCNEDECQLTRTTYGRRFINKELNLYIAFLFETIIARSPSIGFPVSLSRYDLFHGHLFLAANSGRLGILFHAREYPAYEKNVFPYHMGYCQTGSDVRYDKSMNFRNILWLAPLPGESRYTPWDAPGVLVVLDAHPGGIIYKELVSDYVDYVRTIYEAI
ncbi:hypothetical protein EJ110_NYTH10599 [Nymphaea thermarum]|nr:hypothetical protein EJ110_NYTH10599 [Nymphaea thermarum]